MADNNPFDAIVAQKPQATDNPFDSVVGNTSAPTPTVNPFDDAVKEGEARRTRQQFLETLKNSQDIIPERQAKAIEVAQLRGVPVGVAYQYLDELAPKQDVPNYDVLSKDAPGTAKLLADRIKGPIAYPDAKSLSQVEGSLKLLNSTKASPTGPRLPLLDQIFGAGASELTPEQQAAEQQRRVQEAATQVQAATEAERQAQIIADNERKWREQNDPMFARDFGGANYNPNMDLTKSSAAAQVADAKNTLALATNTPPQQKAAAAYFNTILRTLGVGGATAAQGLSALADSLDYWAPIGNPQLDKNGRSAATQGAAAAADFISQLFPADPGRAKDLGMRSTEAVTSALPFVLGGSAVKAMGQSPGWFAGIYGALQQAGQGEADAVANGASINTKNATTWLNLLLGATEALPMEALFATASAGRKGLAQFLAATASNASIEATQNVVQQVPADLWAKFMYDPTRDVMGNAVEAAKMGGLVGSLFGAVAGIVNTGAESNHQNLIAIGDAAKKAKIADIAPQILDDHIAQLKQSGAAPEHVTAPAEAVDTLFQEMDPEGLKQFPETVRSLQEARATGAEVTIPTEELVRLGKLKGYNNFAADVRIGEDMTLNEAVKLREDVSKFVAEQDTTTTATAQEDSPVFQNIRDQLIATGQSREVATAQARLFDAVFTNMSERTGVPVGDLARRYGVEIGNSAVDAAGQTTLSQPGATLASIEEAATGSGVSLAVSENKGVITLSKIVAAEKGQGAGTKVMEALVQYADATGQRLALSPSADFGGSVPRLKEFYKRFGFVENKGRARDLSVSQTMIREPVRQTTLNQTASVRRGDEMLKAFGLEPGKKYNTRDVAAALEARQREIYGKIAEGDYSPEASTKIAKWMLEEVMFEVEEAAKNPAKSAVGWYSTKFQRALDALGAAFPEFTGNIDSNLPGVAILKTKENARAFFTAMMAITSDGAKVADNFRFAAQSYETFRQTGRVNADVTFGGERNTSMRINLENIQKVLDEQGPDQMPVFLLKKDTISNLKKIAKAQGHDFSSAYKASMELPYAAIVFGPKLGAFYANLMGDTGYLTMDRWWSRTFNRYRGTLLQTPTQAGLKRFKELVTADRQLNEPPEQMTDDQALALTVDYVKSYKAKGYKNGTEIEKAANTLYKAAFEGLEDQPFNASDREFMVNTTLLAQKMLEQQGVHLTVADIQAVLWYYEKRLYGQLGARQTQDISYEEIARKVVEGRSDPAAGSADAMAGGTGDEAVLDPGSAGPGTGEVAADAPEEQFDVGDENGSQTLYQAAQSRFDQQVAASRGAFERLLSEKDAGAAGQGDWNERAGSPAAGTGLSGLRVYEPNPQTAEILNGAGVATPPIVEHRAADFAAQFFGEITASKAASKFGASVYVYSQEEYAQMRLFTTEDGSAGFALKSDGDIVSVFSKGQHPNVAYAMLNLATQLGGTKLDCFDTVLPKIYGAVGFVETGRDSWNEEYKPEGWDYETFKAYNNGRPDVVYMEYRPGAAQSLNQGGKQDIRGSITFGPLRDKFRITLTEKANLSTFLHEGGHFFLEVLQDLVARGEASAQQVADLKTLKRWMALEDGKPIDRNGHEKFARTFEAFLMEGKAPSLALHGIFQKFKAWMIFVYKRLANVRGELNDEIRAVMDRLVASDAAIAEARAMVGWRGQPMSQEETGLTDAEYKAYVGEWTKANDAQSADADARIMLEAARELKKTWAEEKIKVTKELEAQLAETRGWKAWKLLQDGEGLEEFGRSAIKIDPDTIPKEWRADTRGMTAPADQDGMDLDMVAELLGFDTGEQMLQSIGGAKLAQKAIPARVRQVMVERHGEMDAAALSQEAMKAVHNTPTMDVLLTEFRALAAKANLKVGKDTKRMITATAEERVAQTPIRKLEPSKWRRAEVKAAEEAGKLAAKGRDMEAALAKRRQLMAAAMTKASLEAQDRASAIKDYLSTFVTNRRRAALGKAGDSYLDQVDQILEAVQFKDVSLKAIKARQGLNEFVKEQEAAGEPVFISDATRELLGRKNYTEMSLEELEGIHDAVKNLWTVAKEINTVRREGEKIALENALAEIEKETEATLPIKKQRDHLNPSRIDKMMEGISRYHAGNLKIEFVLDWLGKTAHSLIYQPITNASYESWKLHRDLTAPFMEKLRKMPKEQKQRWNTKRQFLNYPMPLKGANIWAIALNMGNASNKEKMLAGYGWTEAEVMAELNTFMTKEDWDLAQETWDTINSMWPKMSEVVKRATGLTPPKVEATPIDTPHGTYRGGYFPVVYDTKIDSRMDDKLDSSISPEEMFSKRFTAFVINNGFTKGRTANVGKLLFSPDIIAEHLGEVIHYATHYDAVKQADKIIRSPVFKSLVKTHLGDAVYAEMKQWLKDVATNTTRSDRQPKAGDQALRWARTSAQLTSLGLNIKSALKQPMGIITTLDALKAKHWATGIQKAWLSPYAVQNWKFAFQHSKELGPLVKSYDRDLATISRSYADSIGNRAAQGTYMVAFMPISVMQSVANVAAWHGAYSQATEQGMSEQEAYDFADKVVRTTQGSGALKDLSGMQRGGEANKFFTMFYSYFSVLYNRIADVQVRETGMKNLHRKVGRLTVLLLMGELLNSLFDEGWDKMFPPDKKRKDDDQSFLTRLALNTVDSTINTLPVVRDAYAAVAAVASGGQVRTPPALGGVAKAVAGGKSLRDLIEGKDMTRAKARNIAALAGILTNQPIYGVYRAIDDVFGSTMFPE